MKKLRRIALVLTSVLAAPALAASATGATATAPDVVHLQAPILSLALHGGSVAYYEGTSSADRNGKIAHKLDEVLVWNTRTGKTAKLSGRETGRADTSGYALAGFQLAFDGAQAAWTIPETGNTYVDDRIFTSTLTSRKELRVATVQRNANEPCVVPGPRCAGDWLGGLVATGNRIYVNAWTTNKQGTMTEGALDRLQGKKLVVTTGGTETVEAVSADSAHIAVLRPNGSVGVYSAAGRFQRTVTPTPRAKEVAIAGTRLLILRAGGSLALYDSGTGRLEKTFTPAGKPVQAHDVEVQGTIAVYATGCGTGSGYQICAHGSIRALDLKTGKDAEIGSAAGGVSEGLAKLDSAGLVYASNGWGAWKAGNATLVFVPFARVAAAVS